MSLEAGQAENGGSGKAGARRAQGLLLPTSPPEHCLLQGLQVALASVQGPAGEVDAHGVDADIVWRGEGGEGRLRQAEPG